MKKQTLVKCTIPLLLLALVFSLFAWYLTDYRSFRLAVFRAENGHIAPGQTVFLGDSITDLFRLDLYFPDSGELCNRGINSDTVRGLTERLGESAVCLNPSKIILLIGINDLLRGRDAETVFSEYVILLDSIRNALPDAALYVQSVYPVAGQYEAYNDGVRADNRLLSEYCAQNNLAYLDVYSVLADEDGTLNRAYTCDGLHYTPAGYRAISAFLLQTALA